VRPDVHRRISPSLLLAAAAGGCGLLGGLLGGCAAGRSVTRDSMFAAAPADMDVQAVTLEVSGRRSTLWGDEEAEARLRRLPGVLQVGHAAGRNTLMALTETTISPEALVMALEGDFTVHVTEVVRRAPR
jgi:hypothetical protein